LNEQESFAFGAEAGVPARNPSRRSPRKKKTRKAAAKRGGGGVRAPRERQSASDLARKQRDISVSEFFAKNRHLLGFDNPSKALLTTVKEGVDNSLDACEEAGILPEIRVEIAQVDEPRSSGACSTAPSSTACARAAASRASASAPPACTACSPPASPWSSPRARGPRRRRTTSSW
jgi:hypothetical protein